MTAKTGYKRVLIKVSGEGLCPPGRSGFDLKAMDALAEEIASIARAGVQVGLVVGAGNLLRGRDFPAGGAVHRVTADHMGMLATIINALALQDVLEAKGAPARVMSAIPMGALCETYGSRQAVGHLEKGRVVVYAAGTGSPLFTTDMCAALRAAETGAQAVIKATKVDGVYDSDPVKDPRAKKYDHLTYHEVIRLRLGVMDLTAISLCMEHNIPIIVLSMAHPGALARAVRGRKVGTLISEK